MLFNYTQVKSKPTSCWEAGERKKICQYRKKPWVCLSLFPVLQQHFCPAMRVDIAVQITSGNKTCPQPGFLTLPLWSHHPASPPTPPILHPEAAPKGAHSSTRKEGDPTGSQTLSHCKYQHGSVSYRTIPVPKSFSLKVVEGEIKGALPPEQPGKGARRGEGPSAGKSHASPPACPPYKEQKVRRTKTNEREGHAASTEASTQDAITATSTRSLQGAGDPQGQACSETMLGSALLYTSSASATLHLIFFKDSIATGDKEMWLCSDPGWATHKSLAGQTKLSLLWLQSQQPADRPKS